MTIDPQFVASVMVPPALVTGGAVGQLRSFDRVGPGEAHTNAGGEAELAEVGDAVATGEAPMALARALAAACASAGLVVASVDRPSTNQVAPAPITTTTTAAATMRCWIRRRWAVRLRRAC